MQNQRMFIFLQILLCTVWANFYLFIFIGHCGQCAVFNGFFKVSLKFPPATFMSVVLWLSKTAKNNRKEKKKSLRIIVLLLVGDPTNAPLPETTKAMLSVL